MTTEEDARSVVLAKVKPLRNEKVKLLDSLGRFAGQEIFASRLLPAFDNSAMDGYAVQAQSCGEGAILRVIGEQPAGADRRLTIKAGEAIRIFTGAPLPKGANAVIMQEDVRREGDTIVAQCAAEPGEFIRRAGCDLVVGQKILARGERVTPQLLALIASQGMEEVEVGARPRVAIVSTGDELARPGAIPEPGQIFESNSIMLHALTLRAGAEVAFVEHCPDELETMTNLFRRGLTNDALIVSGGVSVGEHDLVKPALRALGAELDLWRVAIKPGKPFLFARAEESLVFGLPGNPVSAFVTFLKLVRPALLKWSGAADHLLDLPRISARLTSELVNEDRRPHYLRGRLEDGAFTPTGRQESHALYGLSRANALLRVDAGRKFSAGENVLVETLEL
jgi:molybdopterin molybdotransferase